MAVGVSVPRLPMPSATGSSKVTPSQGVDLASSLEEQVLGWGRARLFLNQLVEELAAELSETVNFMYRIFLMSR